MGSRRVLGLVMVCAALAGCAPSQPRQAAPAAIVPPYSHVWSADSGVDLFSRGAELVRATVEAHYEAQTYDPRHTELAYPGYREALIASVVEGGVSEGPDVWAGTQYWHITDFHATDKSVSAWVCGYYIPAVPGHPADPLDRNEFLGDIKRVELVNTGWGPGLPGIRDNTPGRHDPRAHVPPTWNVFGTWRITVLTDHLDAGDRYPASCVPFMRARLPVADVDSDGFPEQPRGFRPPVRPVEVQYPEWIGPADRS